MHDWNVLITTREGGYSRAKRRLQRIGPVGRTTFFNVLVMKADDIPYLLETLRDWVTTDPTLMTCLARVVPATHCFDFQDLHEFEVRTREIFLGWLPALAGKSFHVRVHPRGLGEEMKRMQEEQALDTLLLTDLEQAGMPGRMKFEDPEAIVDVETLGHRAGVSLWTRDDIRRDPFLGLD